MMLHHMNGWWDENDKPRQRCHHLGPGHAVADAHCLKVCPHFKSFQKPKGPSNDYVLCGFPNAERHKEGE